MPKDARRLLHLYFRTFQVLAWIGVAVAVLMTVYAASRGSIGGSPPTPDPAAPQTAR